MDSIKGRNQKKYEKEMQRAGWGGVYKEGYGMGHE